MYAPHSERDRYPKDHVLDVECDDSVQLIPTHTLAPQVFPRLPPAPPPAPAPAPAQPAHPLHYIVSDPLDHTRRQLTHHEFENLDAAALGSLRIEDVVPNRSFPGATLKYAIAPSRANAHRRPDSRRFVRPPSLLSLSPSAPSLSHSSSISPHTSPATSRGYSLPAADDPPPSQDPHPLSRESFFEPGHNVFTEEPKATEPSSDPISAAAHSQPLPSPELAPSSDVPASSSSANVPSTSSGSGLGLPASSSSSTAMVVHSSSGGGKRPARAPKRSPAPRRQECQTCGKKFQRPCQLTTHIRSHTGEQPHACPVCSRRFSVLSNCQRHVKLCQKRSVKQVLPGDEEVVSEPAQGSAFIQYPTEGTSAEVRRPNEVMIRPKPRTNGSGSGFGLGDAAAGAGGSEVGTGKGKAEARKSRSASGSSTSSLGAGEAPVVESSASGSGSSSGATAVPVVPSSPYPTGSMSAGPSYASGGSAYPGAQRGYAQAGEGFERSGPTYEQGYGQTTLGFDRSNSAYDPSRPGYSRPGSSYGPANAAGYDRLAPSGYASSPVYPGFEPSSAGYGQTPYTGSSMPSPSHIQPLSSPSHVRVQPLPSPSHVHIPSLPGPSMYGTPLMGGTPVVGSSIHDASPSSHSSYFHSPPGLYPSRPIPISRRPTIVPSLVQHAALGLSLGQPDTSMREPIGRRPSGAGAGPSSMPSGLGFSNAQMEGAGRPGIKQEDGTAGAGVWSNQETQGQLQGRGQEGERFQAGYQDARWAGAGVGSEPGYNGYQSVSASGMVGSAGGYPYSQQSQQQQLYAQQGGSGFGSSQEPYQSMEGGGTYAEGTAPFGMQANVESDIPKLPHQQFPDYPWPGSEGPWRRQ